MKKIKAIKPPYAFAEYTHIISCIPHNEGGGFMLTIPDIPSFMADGETELDVIKNAQQAFITMVSALHDMGRDIPPPRFNVNAVNEASGKFVVRIPKTLHAQLSLKAKTEGVSLNHLVSSYIAQGLAR